MMNDLRPAGTIFSVKNEAEGSFIRLNDEGEFYFVELPSEAVRMEFDEAFRVCELARASKFPHAVVVNMVGDIINPFDENNPEEFECDAETYKGTVYFGDARDSQ